LQYNYSNGGNRQNEVPVLGHESHEREYRCEKHRNERIGNEVAQAQTECGKHGNSAQRSLSKGNYLGTGFDAWNKAEFSQAVAQRLRGVQLGDQVVSSPQGVHASILMAGNGVEPPFFN
jgi:hypothetical protein